MSGTVAGANRNRPHRGRLGAALLWLGTCGLLVFGLLVQQHRDSRELQAQLAAAELQVRAARIESRLLADSQALRTIATGINSLHGELGNVGYYSELRRLVQGLLNAAMIEQPHWLSLSTMWQVDGFGDNDEVFAGDAEFGSNGRGRFAKTWWRDADGLASRVLDEPELAHWSQRSEAAALDCSWRLQRLCFAMEGAQALLAVPLLEDGELQGVLGIVIDTGLPAAGSELQAVPAVDPDAGTGIAEAEGAPMLTARWQTPDQSGWQLVAGAAPAAVFDWKSAWPMLILLMAVPPLYFAATDHQRKS